MSAMMITTAAILIASTANHQASTGSSGSCPISEFGAFCLGFFATMIAVGFLTLIAAATRSYTSKWSDRWFSVTLILLIGSLIPVIVGMVHDCQ